MDLSGKIKHLKESVHKMQSELKELLVEYEPIPYPPLLFNRITPFHLSNADLSVKSRFAVQLPNYIKRCRPSGSAFEM
jgi:hypothetical protein